MTYQSPITQFNRLRDELDRAFGTMHNRSAGESHYSDNLPVNVWEDSGNIFVEAEVPGLKMDDMEILFDHGNELTIKGIRELRSFDEGKCHRRERVGGRFARTLAFATEIKTDAISASLKHGVLTVTLPKSETVKPKRISVSVDS